MFDHLKTLRMLLPQLQHALTTAAAAVASGSSGSSSNAAEAAVAANEGLAAAAVAGAGAGSRRVSGVGSCAKCEATKPLLAFMQKVRGFKAGDYVCKEKHKVHLSKQKA
jgi:hypothetical protein